MSEANRPGRGDTNRRRFAMSHLLHIDSSASPSSTSRELADAFRTVWTQENPRGIVTYRDLSADPVPHLTTAGISAGFVPEEKRSQELIEELLAADTVLVSTPMYNWSIPSTLKAWIDQVVVSDRTITFDGSPGPLANRAATIVASYGGGYMPGAPREGADHCSPYLQTVFGTGFGMQVEIITAQLGFAFRVPAMANLREVAEQSRAAAFAAVENRARQLAAAWT
jgi:FMN-dependent NADH-azoreductase